MYWAKIYMCIMATKDGRQTEKGHEMSFHKVTYFFLDISKSFFMKLNVHRWLHDGFAPAKRPRKIIRNAKRWAFFVGSTAMQGYCNAPV